MTRLLLASAAVLALTGFAQAQTAVSVPEFKSIELEGGGHVTIKHGDAQRVTLLAGSTQYTKFHIEGGDKLVIEACKDDCPHNYDLRIEIVTPEFGGAAIEGGGHIESVGDFPNQHDVSAAIEGGGVIDLRSIDAAEGNAAVEGGGHISVRVAHSLNAAVEGGGHIEYWGNPQVSSAINGGGSVSRGS
jgi:hypothetical protein